MLFADTHVSRARVWWRSNEGKARFAELVSRAGHTDYQLEAEGARALHLALIGAEFRQADEVDAEVEAAAHGIGMRLLGNRANRRRLEELSHCKFTPVEPRPEGNDRVRGEIALPSPSIPSRGLFMDFRRSIEQWR